MSCHRTFSTLVGGAVIPTQPCTSFLLRATAEMLSAPDRANIYPLIKSWQAWRERGDKKGVIMWKDEHKSTLSQMMRFADWVISAQFTISGRADIVSYMVNIRKDWYWKYQLISRIPWYWGWYWISRGNISLSPDIGYQSSPRYRVIWTIPDLPWYWISGLSPISGDMDNISLSQILGDIEYQNSPDIRV